MSIEFKCPKCAQTLEVAESYTGQAASCPSCSAKVTIPAPGAATVRPNRMFCQKCGMGNDARAAACAGCGHPIRPVAAGEGGALTTMIPYKNVSALLGYYFAVFSLIPCLGSPLGLAAMILGIIGLRKAKAHPEAKGKAHAWVGIILGGLCGLIYTALILVGIVMAVMSQRHA